MLGALSSWPSFTSQCWRRLIQILFVVILHSGVVTSVGNHNNHIKPVVHYGNRNVLPSITGNHHSSPRAIDDVNLEEMRHATSGQHSAVHAASAAGAPLSLNFNPVGMNELSAQALNSLQSAMFDHATLKELAAAAHKENLARGIKETNSPDILVMPPRLDYGDSYTFTPISENLDILNPHHEHIVEIGTIVCKSIHFQINSFPGTKLPSLTRLKIPVVFYPREVGVHTARIIITTSVGSISVTVTGRALKNPYGLHAITDITIPLHTQINPPIYIHNPFERTMNVREVFTTESFLHLGLPESGFSTRQKSNSSPTAKLWEVPAKKTKYIINLTFAANKIGIYNGYIHLKTDNHALILPVEIRVIEEAIELQQNELQFGTFTAAKQTKSKYLNLFNWGLKPILITNIRGEKGDSHMKITYPRGLIIPPRTKVTNFAVFTYSATSASNSTAAQLNFNDLFNISGRILISTNQTFGRNSELSLIYRSRIILGSLAYSKTAILFSMWRKLEKDEHSKLPVVANSKKTYEGYAVLNVLTRDIELTNRFSVPIILLTANLSRSNGGFTLLSFNQSRVVQPGEKFIACSLKFEAQFRSTASQPTPQPYTIHLTITTNISTLHLPLHVYSGQLTMNNLPIEYRYRITANNLLIAQNSQNKIVASNTGKTSGGDLVAFQRRVLSDVNQHGLLEFGRISLEETRQHVITLTNNNPVDLTVFKPRSTAPELHVCFVKHFNPTLYIQQNSIRNSSAGSGAMVSSSSNLKRIFTALPLAFIPTAFDEEETHGLVGGGVVNSDLFHPNLVQKGKNSRSWTESIELESESSHSHSPEEHEDHISTQTEEESPTEEQQQRQSQRQPQAPEQITVSHENPLSLCDSEPSIFLNPGESVAMLFTLKSTVQTSADVASIDSLPSVAFPPKVARVNIDTNTEQNALDLGVSYQTVTGALTIEPQTIDFGSSFPFLHTNRTIYAYHTYPQPISILPIQSSDPRFKPIMLRSTLQPNLKQAIAKIQLDIESDLFNNWLQGLQVEWEMEEDRYSNGTIKTKLLIKHKKRASEPFSSVFSSLQADNSSVSSHSVNYLNQIISEDAAALMESQKKWKLILGGDHDKVFSQLQVLTDVIRGPIIPVSANLKQPKLLLDRSIDFGLIAENAAQSTYVSVKNPSDRSIQFQLLPVARLRYNRSARVEDEIPTDEEILNELIQHSTYTVRQDHASFSVVYDHSTDVATTSIVLLPHSSGALGPIQFHPKSVGYFSGVLLLRNNLTRLAFVRLNGRAEAASVDFKSDEVEGKMVSLQELSLNLTDFLLIEPEYEQRYIDRIVEQHNDLSSSFSFSESHAERYINRSIILENSSIVKFDVTGYYLNSSIGEVVDLCDSERVYQLGLQLLQGCDNLPRVIQAHEQDRVLLRYEPTAFQLPQDLSFLIATNSRNFALPIKAFLPESILSKQVALTAAASSDGIGSTFIKFLALVILLALLLLSSVFVAGTAGYLNKSSSEQVLNRMNIPQLHMIHSAVAPYLYKDHNTCKSPSGVDNNNSTKGNESIESEESLKHQQLLLRKKRSKGKGDKSRTYSDENQRTEAEQVNNHHSKSSPSYKSNHEEMKKGESAIIAGNTVSNDGDWTPVMNKKSRRESVELDANQAESISSPSHAAVAATINSSTATRSPKKTAYKPPARVVEHGDGHKEAAIASSEAKSLEANKIAERLKEMKKVNKESSKDSVLPLIKGKSEDTLERKPLVNSNIIVESGSKDISLSSPSLIASLSRSLVTPNSISNSGAASGLQALLEAEQQLKQEREASRFKQRAPLIQPSFAPVWISSKDNANNPALTPSISATMPLPAMGKVTAKIGPAGCSTGLLPATTPSINTFKTEPIPSSTIVTSPIETLSSYSTSSEQHYSNSIFSSNSFATAANSINSNNNTAASSVISPLGVQAINSPFHPQREIKAVATSEAKVIPMTLLSSHSFGSENSLNYPDVFVRNDSAPRAPDSVISALGAILNSDTDFDDFADLARYDYADKFSTPASPYIQIRNNHNDNPPDQPLYSPSIVYDNPALENNSNPPPSVNNWTAYSSNYLSPSSDMSNSSTNPASSAPIRSNLNPAAFVFEPSYTGPYSAKPIADFNESVHDKKNKPH
jgi:hypothetical protein